MAVAVIALPTVGYNYWNSDFSTEVLCSSEAVFLNVVLYSYFLVQLILEPELGPPIIRKLEESGTKELEWEKWERTNIIHPAVE